MEKSAPQVSIIIPMFNSERFIGECIESILQQTFEDFELIIINDCSTDRSGQIAQNYTDPRVKVIHRQQNFGECASRNFGINIAKGKYIYFIDADDLILPHTLENLVNAAEESEAEVVHMNSFTTFNESLNTKHMKIRNPEPRFLNEDLPQRLQNEFMNHGLDVVAWIKIDERRVANS